MTRIAATVLVTLCSLAVLREVIGVAVMSVDLGSEWMKVAIVSPGVPMEIVLNAESQRKTPTVISFRDGERLIGDAAVTVGARFPEKTFSHLLDLLAKHSNSSAVKLFQKRFPYHNIVDSANGILLSTPDGQQFSPEELISMILTRAKQYAEDASKQTISDCVITVPPYFSQSERKALLLAAQLAKLKVLQLINTNAAFALNYGVFRRKDFNTTPTNILFYDMGAGNTVATIANYQLIKSKEKGFTETHPQLTIKGMGFDNNLGGLEMQYRLRDHLAKMFAEQSKKKLTEIISNHRAMSKLFKEAGRLKKVLSANSEHKAQVENVMNDIDLKAIVTRQQFEDMCADLFGERLYKPIEEAFNSSGYTMSEIDGIIIVGGNTRIPKIQQTLQQYLNKELGKSVNADEAAAMGAAYQAAYLSKGFKVKTFTVKDANLYPIQVEFERESDESSRKPLFRTLFGRNNAFPQKKVITFSKHTKDFTFAVNYGSKPNDYSSNVFNVTLRGVADAIGKHTEHESKGIKAHFRMDENGILNLEGVEAVFETKVADEQEEGNIVSDTISKFGNTISKLFGRGEEANIEEANKTDSESETDLNKNETKSDETDKQTINGTVNATQTATNASTNDTNGESKPKELKLKTLKETIETSIEFIDLSVVNEEEIKKSKEKLEKIDDDERKKLLRVKAINSLESFIIETRVKLEENEYFESATEEEKEKINSQLSSTAEWLEYESEGIDTKVFNDKLNELKTLTKSLFERVREHRERPEALNALKNILNISEMFYSGAASVPEDEQIFSEVELNVLKSLINETKSWMNESIKEQQKLPKSEAPKLTLKSIAEKIAGLDREVKYLLNKARITPPKKKTETKETKNETDDTNKTAENADEELKVEEESDDQNAEQTFESKSDDEIVKQTSADGEPQQTHSTDEEKSAKADEPHSEL